MVPRAHEVRLTFPAPGSKPVTVAQVRRWGLGELTHVIPVRRTREAVVDRCLAAELQVNPAVLPRMLDRAILKPLPGYVQKIARLSARESLAYVMGSATFCGLDLFAERGVFVPSRYTETLVALIVKEVRALAPHTKLRGLDLCTGSGAIAIALAHALPALRMDAVDRYERPVALARRNVERFDLGDQVRVFQGDLYNFPAIFTTHYDFIVANPPYSCTRENIPEGDAPACSAPPASTQGGKDGTAFLTRILSSRLPTILKPRSPLPSRVILEFSRHHVQHALNDWRTLWPDRDVTCHVTGLGRASVAATFGLRPPAPETPRSGK